MKTNLPFLPAVLFTRSDCEMREVNLRIKLRGWFHPPSRSSLNGGGETVFGLAVCF